LIRTADPHDSTQIAGILSGFIDATSWMPRLYSRAEELCFADTLIRDHTTYVYISGTKEVLGFITLKPPEVLCLYVHQNHLRMGIGQALLQAAQNSNATLELFTFQTNAPARAFYAAQGFHEIGFTQGENDEGLPDVKLRWMKQPQRTLA
jgi:ribosomal protein S18 acetylase RimI-like enzyme